MCVFVSGGVSREISTPPPPGPRGTLPGPRSTPPTVNRITDRCKNITFPQLRLQAVTILRRFVPEQLVVSTRWILDELFRKSFSEIHLVNASTVKTVKFKF